MLITRRQREAARRVSTSRDSTSEGGTSEVGWSMEKGVGFETKEHEELCSGRVRGETTGAETKRVERALTGVKEGNIKRVAFIEGTPCGDCMNLPLVGVDNASDMMVGREVQVIANQGLTSINQ